jgi:energy-coupling factor transporter transmembrane protein EcfT
MLTSLSSYESVVKVYAPINNASLLAMFSLSVILFLIMVVTFISGRSLNWLPKIFLMIFLSLVVLSFTYGWYITEKTKKELNERGYVECESKRDLGLKYSSRTYALSPDICSSE